MKILVLGNSHVQVLQKAHALRKNDTRRFDFQFILVGTQKNEQSHDAMSLKETIGIVATLGERDFLAISVAGTLHNIFGLLQHARKFDFFLAESDCLTVKDDVEIIPKNVLYGLFEQARDNKQINQLQAKANCQFCHIGCPPPKSDEGFLKKKTRHYRDQSVAKVGFSSPELRLKLWKFEMMVLKNLCNGWGGYPPPEALTSDGFLCHEFYGSDATHANIEYGELVLRQIEKRAQIALEGEPSRAYENSPI